MNAHNIVDTINPLVLFDYTAFCAADRTTKLFPTLIVPRANELLVFIQYLVTITLFKWYIDSLRMEQINIQYTLTIQCLKKTYFFLYRFMYLSVGRLDLFAMYYVYNICNCGRSIHSMGRIAR